MVRWPTRFYRGNDVSTIKYAAYGFVKPCEIMPQNGFRSFHRRFDFDSFSVLFSGIARNKPMGVAIAGDECLMIILLGQNP